MKIVEQHLLIDLLGAEVVNLSRILSEDTSLQQSYVAKSALVLTLADGQRVEMLTGQAITRLERLTETQGLFLGYEIDLDERLSLCALTGELFDEPPKLPLRIGQVTEVWAGEGQEAFLVALWVAESGEAPPRFNLCTESDEIEVMTPEQMQERLKQIALSYSGVTRRSYGT